MVRENLARIQERISNAAARAGRTSEEVTLIAVSKTHPADAVREAYEAGVRHFGENRVQEWEGKHATLQDLDATWHLIGYLQSNKANKAARLFFMLWIRWTILTRRSDWTSGARRAGADFEVKSTVGSENW